MFYKKDLNNYRQPLDGVTYKTLTYGAKTLLSEFRLQKGYSIPIHKHPHEQTGYLVSGRMTFTLDGKDYEAEAGDSWNIPGDVEHGVLVHEDSIVIEVFSPVREDYLP